MKRVEDIKIIYKHLVVWEDDTVTFEMRIEGKFSIWQKNNLKGTTIKCDVVSIDNI